MPAYFVTATGTDVGKTFVTCGLIRALKQRGQSVDALKPVISGFYPPEAEGSDPGLLLAALGRPVNEDEIARIAPWRFAAPLSPDMAARREGRSIDFDALVAFTRDATRRQPGTLLIEGVGGVMVPLGESRTVLDWMAALRVPVILVAGSYLGTISHTLSAVDVLSRHGLTIAAVVVSESEDSPVPLDETTAAIARFVPSPVIALPRLDPGTQDHPTFERLVDLALKG